MKGESGRRGRGRRCTGSRRLAMAPTRRRARRDPPPQRLFLNMHTQDLQVEVGSKKLPSRQGRLDVRGKTMGESARGARGGGDERFDSWRRFARRDEDTRCGSARAGGGKECGTVLQGSGAGEDRGRRRKGNPDAKMKGIGDQDKKDLQDLDGKDESLVGLSPAKGRPRLMTGRARSTSWWTATGSTLRVSWLFWGRTTWTAPSSSFAETSWRRTGRTGRSRRGWREDGRHRSKGSVSGNEVRGYKDAGAVYGGPGFSGRPSLVSSSPSSKTDPPRSPRSAFPQARRATDPLPRFPCSNHRADLESDAEGLQKASEQLGEILESPSLEEAEKKIDLLLADGAMDPAMMMVMAKARAGAKESTMMKEEAKDVMFHLYNKARDGLTTQQPTEFKILKHAVSQPTDRERRTS